MSEITRELMIMADNLSLRTGGHILADQLRVLGADTVFCVPGESFLDLLTGSLITQITFAPLCAVTKAARPIWPMPMAR
ncbi:hypothetical protein IMCC21224_111963 [Puniceibacterium sp. IMCC21224]|nr:hypothetical protein IMCC21224_111963 [Puniceibacterium sp. IMCC21224]